MGELTSLRSTFAAPSLLNSTLFSGHFMERLQIAPATGDSTSGTCETDRRLTSTGSAPTSRACRLLASWLAHTLQSAHEERRCTERSDDVSISTSGKMAPWSEMSFLLLSFRIEHSDSAPADCDCANVSFACSSPMRCGIAPTSATRCLLLSLSTQRDHKAPAACAAAAWFSLWRTSTRTSRAPDVAIVSFELMLAARLQIHAAAADCMKGTSGDG
mmetsp:Transcript_19254/g.37479  ORF Transcript_19254/g.37479 Transcript_19254/m.37479 type:complete len:216 (-) Transcript_19254:786-1433(-)